MNIDFSPVSGPTAEDAMLLASATFVDLVEWSNSTRWRLHMMERIDFPLMGDVSAFLVVNQLTYRGATRPSVLAGRLESGSSNISKCVRRLEVAALAVRVADPDDDRAVLVALTSTGRELGAKIREVLVEDWAAALANWTDTELAVMQAILVKLQGSLGPLIAGADPPVVADPTT